MSTIFFSARLEKNSASEASGSHCFCSRFKPEIWRKCSNSSSVNCALHAKAIVDGIGVSARIMLIYKQLSRSVNYLSQSCQQSLIQPIRSWYQELVSWNGGINGMSTGSPAHSLLTRPLSAHPVRPRLLLAISNGSLFAGYVDGKWLVTFLGKIAVMVAMLLWAGRQRVKGEGEDQNPLGDVHVQ